MSFLESLKTEANYTTTLNGAKTHGSTGEACLDFFAVAGGMRYRSVNDQIRLFERAYIETPELAMKLLFHIRDIRGGMGERKMFRTLLRFVAKRWPESAKKNVHLISEYGRYDDLLCLLKTPAEHEAVDVIKRQLEADMQSLKCREEGDIEAPISLLAKWMPSDNTSSVRTRNQAKYLMELLQMDSKSYRKMLTTLRANICLTERYLTRKTPEKINYESVPGNAMLKYRQAFERNDEVRFKEYLKDVKCGKKSMNSDTLFPYEILRPYFGNDWWKPVRDADGMETLEALWENLSTDIAVTNAVSVVDTSGSMYCRYKNAPLPALISQALGIYFAERCIGPFHNHVITFESVPHLVELQGKTLRDKLSYLQTVPWGMSTNLEAVFELILTTAVKTHASQKEMPSVIYIFSDMEFNRAVRDPEKTVYENAKEMYELYGYKMPAVVFHNVNSWQMQTPVTAHTRGTALTSGAGVAAFQSDFDGNVTPMTHMLRVLNSDRYKEVHA